MFKRFIRLKAHIPAFCSTLIRHKTIKDVGGFEESFRGLYEDQVFFAKVWLKETVFLQDGHWDKYRQHQESSCSVAKKDEQYNSFKTDPIRLTFLTWLEQHLKEQCVNDPEIWQGMTYAFFPYRHPLLYFLLKVFIFFIYRLKMCFIFLGKQTLPIHVRKLLRDKWKNFRYRSLDNGN